VWPNLSTVPIGQKARLPTNSTRVVGPTSKAVSFVFVQEEALGLIRLLPFLAFDCPASSWLGHSKTEDSLFLWPGYTNAVSVCHLYMYTLCPVFQDFSVA
jgi:hypothetical protein